LGGVEGVIVATPEIHSYELTENVDYVLLCCDGIFDVLTNDEVNDIIWETVRFHQLHYDDTSADHLGRCLNDCVNNLLKRSLLQDSEDNVTAILVAYRNLLEV
jgi:serine/threonine protein phosphatase PrpC